jgi:hypothetical protein
MAKIKLAGSKRRKIDSKRGLIPCGVVILIIFAAIFWLCYLVLKSN